MHWLLSWLPRFRPAPTPTPKVANLGEHLLWLLNLARAKHHSPPLALNDPAARAAAAQSAAQAISAQAGHGDPTRSLLSEGYPPCKLVGECIGEGFVVPETLIAACLRSPGHRDILLNPVFTHAGSGMAIQLGVRYWTIVLVAPGVQPATVLLSGPLTRPPNPPRRRLTCPTNPREAV